jgi:hypothetical protein
LNTAESLAILSTGQHWIYIPVQNQMEDSHLQGFVLSHLEIVPSHAVEIDFEARNQQKRARMVRWPMKNNKMEPSAIAPITASFSV